jgi:acetyl-CoA acetyltransferase family protein
VRKYALYVILHSSGGKNGELIGMLPDDLAAEVVKALLERNSFLDSKNIEDLVLGCAFPEGPQGMLLGRAVALLAGIPKESCAKVVNRFCGSSMDSVHQVCQAILAGDIHVGIAAGVEDMFAVPMGGFAPSFNPTLYEQEFYIGMGETAENLAKELNVSREDQDIFAINSHRKALDAWNGGRFDDEVAPIEFNGTTVSKDECPRQPDEDKIKSLDAAFVEGGSVTAASSSPISMGASALLIISNKKCEELGHVPKFRVVSRAVAGVDWKTMGSGPLPATDKALKNAGLSMNDIDFIELNEAFAAQSLYVIRKGGWDESKINVNGGAISLGHPLGCSGARILITLMNVMKQNECKYGLATMCIGTGMGIATIIEKL